MKVMKRGPKPVEVPPPTYDLLGLTEDQVKFLHNLLGNFAIAGEPHPHTEIYKLLDAELFGNRYEEAAYAFYSDSTSSSAPVNVFTYRKVR